MNWLKRVWQRIRPGDSDAAIRDEMEFHLEMRAREYMADGLGERQAREKARRQFGNAAVLAENTRETSPWFSWMGVLRDVRYAVRRLRRDPGFAAVTVTTLAVGIGAASLMFSLLNAVVLAPLPFERQERLVAVWENNPARNIDEFSVSKLNYLSFAERTHGIEGLAAFAGTAGNLAVGGETLRVQAMEATVNLFGVLGVEPALGRAFRADEGSPGGEPVALISQALWRSRYASDPDAVGQTMQLNGASQRIVGVMPAELAEAFRADVWLPMVIEPGRERRDNRVLNVVGRLAGTVSREEAAREMNAVARNLGQEFPDSNKGWRVKLEPLADALLPEESRNGLWILLAAVGFLLLIACGNVANLLLVRATAQRQEFALRSALGAGTGRLARQLLVESLVLGLAGAAAGALLAYGGLELVRWLSVDLPRIANAAIDGPVLAFALACAVGTSVLFGLAPAIDAARHSGMSRLRSGSRSVADDGARGRFRTVLVVGEIAAALVLAFAASLLAQSYLRVERTPLGFRSEQLLTANLSLPPERFAEDADWVAHYDKLLARLRAEPGVVEAGLVSRGPFMGYNTSLNIRPYTPGVDDRSQEFQVSWRIVSPSYFPAMGIPVLAGEVFAGAVGDGPRREVLLSREVAQHFWPEGPVAGQLVQLGNGGEPARVAGVVGDIRHMAIERAEHPTMYISHRMWQMESMTLVLRTAMDPEALVEPLRRAVREFDASMPLYEVRTMESRVRDSFSERTLSTALLLGFAIVALGLAALGVYGLISYSVTRRTREIGVRAALGADMAQIVRLVTVQGLRLAAVGIVLGLAGAVALRSVLESMVYETSVTDPVTLLGAGALLVGVTLLACAIPAARAARVDPASALRAE